MIYRAPQEHPRGPHWDLAAILGERDIEVVLVSSTADLESITSDMSLQIVLVDMADLTYAGFRTCVELCAKMNLPVLALIPPERVTELDVALGIDDFVICPPNIEELETRAKRVIYRASSPDADDVIRVGDLTINPTSYEVAVAGKRVNLRFKEYELLRLLATNPGRVYSREALLSQIWGFDYFGGTRTVDVHIRRLRSKIEIAETRFIETIWNVGYRFSPPNQVT